MEKSCLKIPFVFLQFTKKAQKAILWSRIHVFVKFVIFAGKLLSFRILYLACPKHVGTSCTHFLASNSMLKIEKLEFFDKKCDFATVCKVDRRGNSETSWNTLKESLAWKNMQFCRFSRVFHVTICIHCGKPLQMVFDLQIGWFFGFWTNSFIVW